jgi:hypothetical protein
MTATHTHKKGKQNTEADDGPTTGALRSWTPEERMEKPTTTAGFRNRQLG